MQVELGKHLDVMRLVICELADKRGDGIHNLKKGERS